jgi:glycosyltransferase involved in cell wall biosynthesis
MVRTGLRTAEPLRRLGRRTRRHLDYRRGARRARTTPADLAIFHDFEESPAGGAHQTLRAVLSEIERRGVRVAHGTIPPETQACLFNSFNFDFDRLAFFAVRRPAGCRMVHRVGAVTSLYRGFDDGTDARVAELNNRLADATLAISQSTIDMYRSIGIDLVAPRVVHNAVDATIFHPHGRVAFDRGRKTRLVAVSWSDNPRKGGPVYRWLESVLDRDRYEFTYVGNVQERFDWIRHVPPLPSRALARLLREQDVFITATQNDAYSNALVEALACGLPAVYLDSGGSREAVGEAGFSFDEQTQIPALLERMRDEHEARQALISLPTLAEIADQYLDLLGLQNFADDDRAG